MLSIHGKFPPVPYEGVFLSKGEETAIFKVFERNQHWIMNSLGQPDPAERR